MLTNLVEGLLPGARNLRPPLLAGLLWTLFGWIAFADQIPHRASASGWAAQAYAVISAAGPVATGVTLSVLVFVIGALLSGLSDGISVAVGAGAAYVQRAFRWQRHAQRARQSLRREAAEARSRAEKSEQLVEANEADKSKMSSYRKTAKMQRARYDEVAQRLAAVERQGWRRLRIADSSANRRALGQPPALAHAGLEDELVQSAWSEGTGSVLDELTQSDIASEDFFWRVDSPDREIVDRFQDELDTDPLEVVRALNESLYLELDRMRSEREVRLAIATPVLALCIYLGVEWSAWMLLSGLLPLAFLVRYSFASSQERTLVLQLLRLNDLKTPALRRAVEGGRAKARAELRARQREREQERGTRRIASGVATAAAPPMEQG